ncbi:MAG: ParB/RepB/Spo0J family partition protein [Verrucomicrobia bacterium]|nr:ParB/RepB/Spo0J family partition protein [Verrucomicrobiota bacterium]MBS0635974.1 ParB/RepB/Spo0J family partition protein [Verrucomicrobiota bacterium]
MQALQEISLNDVVSNRYQPRSVFVEQDIVELAESIREMGLLHPPVVVKILGTSQYEIVAGERRVMACRHLGLKNIQAVVRERPTLEEIAHLALIENVQRVDLNPLEIAKSIKTLIDDFNLSQEEIAQKIGKKRSTVANYLRILQLPREMQQAIHEGKISLAHAKVLLSCPQASRQKLFQKMLKENLTVEKATKLAKNKNDDQIYYQDLENRLKRHFGMRVEVNGAKNRGSIVLSFADLDELDTILDKIGLRC